VLKTILLTVDVEDWFQVENFKSAIPFSTWNEREIRVERNTHRLLDLFEAIKPSHPTNSTNSIKSTFFILGWIADRLPDLVKEIHDRGHEVASHGATHELCTKLKPEELKMDLTGSKARLEDLVGARVWGYRAPSFSINRQILNIIEDSGYRYDSSYNSFGLHGRYGKVDLSDCKRAGIAYVISETFHELPVSNLEINGRTLPWSGGGYFRLIPLFLFKLGIKKILKNTNAYLFYMHPWEIDPDQPRVTDIPRSYRFRHYINLQKTYTKLSRIVEEFNDCWFITLRDYLKGMT
jgi:polysaccharide deacetylase family protein (PEP-CTERM system associated)